MIKLERPLWVAVLIWMMVGSMLLMVVDCFYRPEGLSPWVYKLLNSLPLYSMGFLGVSLIAINGHYRRLWLRVKRANGQECPGCQYPSRVEAGGKCTECGLDFTPEIIERWVRWWSADRDPPHPNHELRAKQVKSLVFMPIQTLRQSRFFPSRSKPTPTPPTPDAPPPPQPDPLASKTDA
jgi:hypothetical protein